MVSEIEITVSIAVDAKGVKADAGAIVVVECRRHTTSRLKQSAVASLRWTISDVGASGGIVVAPLGVQEIGQILAKSSDIEIIHLGADSTTTDYVLKFVDKVFLDASDNVRITDTFTAEISRPDKPAL